ncbi:MAG: heat-inducible transcription repressor HrcA [Clostridiales bacterium]|nr:heat-inducible transcription repressor HrcA [Clostridiales bacterium]
MAVVMDTRKGRILNAIIEDYIQTAQPVGSRTLEKKYFPSLSSATIRNEMSDLAELGYLLQPHVSAGRVPSHTALRRFAKDLLNGSFEDVKEEQQTRDYLYARRGQTDDLMPAAAQVLSELTSLTAIVMMPGRREQKISRVQLIALNRGQALLVLVTDSGETSQTVIRVTDRLDSDGLYAISKALTEKLSGQTLGDVRKMLDYYRQSGAEGQVLDGIAALAGRIEKQSAGETVVLGGRHNILNYPEYADITKARDFLSVLEENEQMLSVMRKTSNGFSVLIGDEIGVPGTEDCALISTSFGVAGGHRGTVNIIGPARMPYARVLSTMRLVSGILTELMGGNE